MPWSKRVINGKVCVVKATTGKVLHCYDCEDPDNCPSADKYLAALYMHMPSNEKELDPGVYVTKEQDGRYKIIAVSTAALKDREGDTFDVGAIDYDIAQAKETGEYPEFRVFHNAKLDIGKVEKMSRAGIFAIDEGHSYTDQFSNEVCEKMLVANDGKWRVSRGFYVVEASGGCPQCKENLVVEQKHMVAGFRCPTCKSLHPHYKGILTDVHFRKTKTFEDTITDIPCVPYTGVTAFKLNMLEDVQMTKKELKEKLLAAGISEEAVEARLKEVTDEQLKQLSDIPFAEVLKEFQPDEKDKETVEEDETFVLDESVLVEFGKIVSKEVAEQLKEALDGFEIELPDLKGVEVEVKELPQIVELKQAIDALVEKVDNLLEADKEKVAEALADMPRNGKLRILRSKATKKPKSKLVEDETTDEEDEEDGEEEMPFEKKQLGIVGADGFTAKSMTEFITKKN